MSTASDHFDFDARRRAIHALPRWVRAADYLALLLLALTVYIVLFGGIHVGPTGLRVSITSAFRLLVECAAVVAIRQFAWRSPSFADHLAHVRDRLRRWPAAIGPAVAIVLLTRVPVLLVGYVAVSKIGYPINAPPEWRLSNDEVLNLPARWDTGWYLGIALHGYSWNPAVKGQQNLAFFPAFPMLMRATSALVWQDVTDPALMAWAGTMASLAAFFCALLYLFYLARDQIGDEVAVFALTLLASYPFALFYGATYTESLFLLSAAGTFYHFSRRQLGRAAAWGLVAGLVRPNGWTLAASLALLALPSLTWMPQSVTGLVSRFFPQPGVQSSSHANRPGQLMLLTAIAAPVVGLAIYCGYIYWLTGHPLTWARLMVFWDRDFRGASDLQWYYQEVLQFGVFRFIVTRPFEALNAMGLLFGLLTIWPVTKRLGPAYGLFVLANIALPSLSGGLVSIGRYSSVLFPCFFWAAAVAPKPSRPPLVALFALGQGLAAALFFTWRGIY